jgi:hypothetical protein
MFSLDVLFCHVDDFCKAFEAQWHRKLLNHGGIKRVRAKSLCLSEIMTIVNFFCRLIAYCHQPKKPSLQLESLLPPYL